MYEIRTDGCNQFLYQKCNIIRRAFIRKRFDFLAFRVLSVDPLLNKISESFMYLVKLYAFVLGLYVFVSFLIIFKSKNV